MPPELFPPRAFSITPEAGRREPRLWVRRLVIWREPGVVIRDISLRPGLNIIWSPDPGTGSLAPIGHGSGKTTFCRLLRYCLGEDSFAPESQRRSTLEKFPQGQVGAEVIVEGRTWVVVRSLGDRRHDIVIEDGVLDGTSHQEAPRTGIDPLRQLITRTILGDAASLMPPAIGESGAWEAVLAWATRDQECRFAHYLDWRDQNTDSNSPVRRSSREDHVSIVRASIGALPLEEIENQRIKDGNAKESQAHKSRLDQFDWQIKRAHDSLTKGLFAGERTSAGFDLDATVFKAAAAEHYARAMNLPADTTTIDLEGARRDRDAARDERDRLKKDLEETVVRIDEKGKSLSLVRSELPEAHARYAKGSNPVCPICNVLIDKALANGCGLSLETCDLKALQASIAERREQILGLEKELAALKARKPGLETDVALAQQRLEPLERTVTTLEQAQKERSTSIRAAERLVDESERYQTLLTERSEVALAVEKLEGRMRTARDTLAGYRSSVIEVFRHLSTTFDAVLRDLVPGNIKGDVKLDGNGITLKVELDGVRTTTAIDSLKVIGFDLSVLAMTIEGQTRLPGFFVHDSPREADLGLSVYHPIFDFVRRLEGFGSAPLFQYIITTTTEPPKHLLTEPWLRLTIHGSPANERLLGADL